jgi:hypothetical protein
MKQFSWHRHLRHLEDHLPGMARDLRPGLSNALSALRLVSATAELCWNADLNVDALLHDYFTKFYGPAAGPMREYFLAMDRSMEEWNACVSYGLQGVSGLKVIGPEICRPEVMARMGGSLEQAERLVAGDVTLAERVGLARRMYGETQQALGTINKR